MLQVGRISEIVRYPVKSMAGIATESAMLGWHGLEGDRRFAVRRLGDDSGFPWLSASRLPELLLYRPVCRDDLPGETPPTHVQTPTGLLLELRGDELRREIAERLGSGVELMQLRQGIFDEGSLSVINLATIFGIGRQAGLELDRRRFRANVLLDTTAPEPFLEDRWVGGTLVFGDREPRPAVWITARDARCAMLNLDPVTGRPDPRVMQAVVDLNANNAGVYATVVQPGTIHVGQTVSLSWGASRRERTVTA